MEIFGHCKVMVMLVGFTKWMLILTSITLASSTVCPQGKQYLHQTLQVCVNCTVCDSEMRHVVLRPCEVHRDTICGPLSELTLKWKLPHDENRHRHGHHNRHHHKPKDHDDGTQDEYKADARLNPTSSELIGFEVTSTEVAFSGAESLVWDWQAIAFTLAVFACILFFLVIAVYSLHQAKQWRRLKENFEADVEELSARLSLMATSSNEKGEILEPRLGPIHDGNYLQNRCVYLEQLLHVRKDAKIGSDSGNVYIEKSASLTT